jgi:tetratricopeptide (TPR) repeat protein
MDLGRGRIAGPAGTVSTPVEYVLGSASGRIPFFLETTIMSGISALAAPLVIFMALALTTPAPPAHAFGGPDPAEALAEAVDAIGREDYHEAIRLLDTVIENDRRNANAYNYLGYSHRKLGKYELAIEHYSRALKIDSNHRGANEYLGEAYLELKNPRRRRYISPVSPKSAVPVARNTGN